jgi:hypothetical protein
MSEVKGKSPARPIAPAPAPIEAAAAQPPAIAVPAAVPIPAPPRPAPRQVAAAGDLMAGLVRDTFTGLAEVQAAMAGGLSAMALEVTGLVHAGATAAQDGAAALLGAKTLAEAIDVQIGLARRNLDTLAAGSIKLTEIGSRLAREASRPTLPRGGPLA